MCKIYYLNFKIIIIEKAFEIRYNIESDTSCKNKSIYPEV